MILNGSWCSVRLPQLLGVEPHRWGDALPKYCRVTLCYLGGPKPEGSVSYCTADDSGVGWDCV